MLASAANSCALFLFVIARRNNTTVAAIHSPLVVNLIKAVDFLPLALIKHERSAFMCVGKALL